MHSTHCLDRSPNRLLALWSGYLWRWRHGFTPIVQTSSDWPLVTLSALFVSVVTSIHSSTLFPVCSVDQTIVYCRLTHDQFISVAQFAQPNLRLRFVDDSRPIDLFHCSNRWLFICMLNFHGCMLPDEFSVYATLHQFQAIQSFGHGIFDSMRFLDYNRAHVITISALLANWVRILRQVFLIARVIQFSIIPRVLRLALICTPQAFTYFQPQLGVFLASHHRS